MKCPACGDETHVTRSRESNDGYSVTRTRTCKANLDHRFDTIERRQAHGLDTVLVRQSGDRLISRFFDRNRLLDDIRDGVMHRLDDAVVGTVVAAAVNSLEARLPDLMTPPSPEELEAWPTAAGVITDHDISDAVETQLKAAGSRIGHVMYALYVRGRANREGRTGWKDAADVLEWLYDEPNYPHLREEAGPRNETLTDEWYPPAIAPEPSIVLKRSGRRSEYRHRQFAASLRRPLIGRQLPTGTSHCIVQWVLWGLIGQKEVRTSQLDIGVLDCLRRVDDIAYLRWVVVSKNIESVQSFRDEAIGLLTHPSPRLSFAVESTRILPPTRRGSSTEGAELPA